MDPLAKQLLVELALAFLRSRGAETPEIRRDNSGTVRAARAPRIAVGDVSRDSLLQLTNAIREESDRLQAAFGDPDDVEELARLRALVAAQADEEPLPEDVPPVPGHDEQE